MLRGAMPGRTALRRFARPMSSLPTEVAAVVYGNVRKQLATALLNAVDIDVTRPMSMSIALREPLETRAGGGKVLDFMTGTGVVAGLAAARGAEEVVAIDASADLLQLATSELAASFKPRVEGETYDTVVKVQSWTDATLQFADDTFDAVVLNVEDVADPAAALKESFRVLKKGGKVSFAAWADATPSALRLLIDATGASAADFFPLATEGAAKEALVAAGFDGATFAFEAVPAHLPLTTGADCVAVFAAGGAPARRALAAADAATVGAQLASAVESSFVGTWQDASEMNWNKDEIHATVPGTGWAATSGYAARIGALGEGTVAGADHAYKNITTGVGEILEVHDGRKPFMLPMPAVVASATK